MTLWVELSPNLTLTPLLEPGNSLLRRKTFGPKVPGNSPRALGLLFWLLVAGPRWMRIRLVSLPKGAGLELGSRVSFGKIAPNWISKGSFPEP